MDKDAYIFDNLINKYSFIQNLYPDYSFFGVFLRGSQNYGLDIYNDKYQSDIDTVAFIIPALDDLIWKTKFAKEIVCDDQSHIELKDIRDLLMLIDKANPTYIELINTDYYIINPQYQTYFDQILCKRNELSLMNYDGKCLAHIIRFRIMVTSLLNGNPFKEAMLLNENERCYLKQLKSYEIIYDYNKAYDIATKEIDAVEKMIHNHRNLNLDFNQKMYDYLCIIIENLIKDDVF